VGDACGNALAETTIGLYKTELIKAEGPWRDPDQVEAATLERVHWYNTERTHEAIDDLTPGSPQKSSTIVSKPPSIGRDDTKDRVPGHPGRPQ
jgi:transposase InsO family protein